MTRPRLLRLPLIGVVMVSLWALVPAAAQAQSETPTVSVTGSETKLIANDTASVTFSVSRNRRTARAALEVTSRRLRRVISKVREAGDIDAADVQTGRISVLGIRIRDDEGNVVRRVYIARQSVTVIVEEVKRTGFVITAGVRAGAGVSGPRFYVADSEAAYERGLLRAFDAAERKARALAERAGRELGPVLRIIEGGGVFAVDRSASALHGGDQAASAPIRPGKSRVRARVSVTFEMVEPAP